MKAVLATVALSLLAGAGYAQEAVKTRASGEDEVKAAILKKVEERLKANQERILAEVKKMLDDHFAKLSGQTQPPRKMPGFLGIQAKVMAEGLQILQVIKDTPAAKVGLQKDDVVISVNGKKVSKLEELVSTLRGIGAGEKAKVEFKRGDKVSIVTATLALRKDDDDDDDDGDDDDDDD